MVNEEYFEELSMQIIAGSGEGRSLAYAALEQAKAGNAEGARDTLESAKKALIGAHEYHSELVRQDASSGGKYQSALAVHAQCHMMCSMVVQEMVGEMIALYQKLEK